MRTPKESYNQYQRGAAAARSRLSAKDFAAAWAAGRELTLEQALAAALALSEFHNDQDDPPSAS